MPTPDPIALPECPPLPAWLVDSCQSQVWAAAWETLSRHITALTPTPQVQGDMVLLPRRATPEMLADFWYTATGSTGGGFWLTKRQLARARKAYAAMLAAAPSAKDAEER